MEKVVSVIKENLIYIIIILIVLFIKIYIFSPIRVSGESMHPTLEDKDIMILNEYYYRFNDIKRFDIIVIKLDNEYIIKRVIGLPGEKIEYKDNNLYVNDKKIKENFSHEKTIDFKANVSKDGYFVLGDNRVNSTDSRVLGAITKDKIKGKTNLTIFPFNRLGDKR